MIYDLIVLYVRYHPDIYNSFIGMNSDLQSYRISNEHHTIGGNNEKKIFGFDLAVRDNSIYCLFSK